MRLLIIGATGNSGLALTKGAMIDQDVDINAAGNATGDAENKQMVKSVIATAAKTQGAGGRF